MGVLTKRIENDITKVGDVIQNAGDILSSTLNRVMGYTGAAAEYISTAGGFVGLDYTKVDDIRDAIRKYTEDIQKAVDELNTKADESKALKGEFNKDVKDYVAAIAALVDAHVSGLKAFSDKMKETHDKYVANDEKLQEDVGSEAQALKNSAADLAYTEKY